MRFLIIYMLVQMSFFWGAALGRFFSQCFCRRQSTTVTKMFFQPPSPTLPHHNKASYGPAANVSINQSHSTDECC